MNDVAVWAPSVALAGLLLMVWSSLRNARAGHLLSSVLRGNEYTARDRATIRRSILRMGTLPNDPRLHDAALVWAREIAQYGPWAMPWRPFQYLGTIMLLCIAYLVPQLVGLAIAIQAILVLIALGAIPYEWKGIKRCKTLVGLHQVPQVGE